MTTDIGWTRLIARVISDTTLPALLRIRKYLRSAGRYGASSFLVGHYGGSGEIAQGFCRTAAVAGGIYILGRSISSIIDLDPQPISQTTLADSDKPPLPKYSVELDDFPEKLSCSLIISSPDHVPRHLLPIAKHVPSSVPSNDARFVVRCIAIIDRPIVFSATSLEPPSDKENPVDSTSFQDQPPARQDVDTAVLIFPPSSLSGGSTTTVVHVLITGEGCMATPSGKCKFDEW